MSNWANGSATGACLGGSGYPNSPPDWSTFCTDCTGCTAPYDGYEAGGVGAATWLLRRGKWGKIGGKLGQKRGRFSISASENGTIKFMNTSESTVLLRVSRIWKNRGNV